MHRHFITIFLSGFLISGSVRAQSFALVLEWGYWKAIDLSGKTLADSLATEDDGYRSYQASGEGMFAVIRNNRIGFKNAQNQLVIPCTYSPASVFNQYPNRPFNDAYRMRERHFVQGQAVVVSPGGKMGVIDTRGHLVIDTVYDFIAAADTVPVYVVQQKSRIKIVNRSGKDVLPFYYQTDPELYPMPHFSNGLLPVMVKRPAPPPQTGRVQIQAPEPDMPDYKVGFVNYEGRLVIDTIYELSTYILRSTASDRAAAMLNRSICGTGRAAMARETFQESYYLNSDYYRFEGNRCMVYKPGTSGGTIINTAGDSLFAIGPVRSVINDQGYFIVTEESFSLFESQGGNTRVNGVINPMGKQILELSFREIGRLGDGLFRVSTGENGHFRYADTTGRFRFGKSFAIANDFSDGFATVKYSYGITDRDYGHIDLEGKFVGIDKAWILGRSEGLILASTKASGETGYGFMNTDYSWVIKPKYAGLEPMQQNRAAFGQSIPGKGVKWGFIDHAGNEVIAPQYDRVISFQKVEIK